MVGDLLGELGLNSLEQVLFVVGRLLAGQDLTYEHDIDDIEAIEQQMGERPAGKRNAADGLTSLQGSDLGDDASFVQVRHQQAEATKPVIAAEDVPDAFGFSFVDGNLPVLGLIAERGHAADPKALAFRGRDLVPDPLGGESARHTHRT